MTDGNLGAVESAPAIPENKVFTQDDLNKHIGSARIEGREQGRREALAEIQGRQAQNYAAPTQNVSQGSGTQQNPITQEQVERMTSDAMQKHQQQAAAYQVANQFLGKLQAAKDKYPDIEKSIDELRLKDNPNLIHLTNEVDNTADVVQDLRNNPGKIPSLLVLSHTHPELARNQIRALSQSIKSNQQAQDNPVANDPLSQSQPSITRTDAGPVNVNYFKNKFRQKK